MKYQALMLLPQPMHKSLSTLMIVSNLYVLSIFLQYYFFEKNAKLQKIAAGAKTLIHL